MGAIESFNIQRVSRDWGSVSSVTSLLGAKMGLPFPESGILPDRPLSHFPISLWWVVVGSDIVQDFRTTCHLDEFSRPSCFPLSFVLFLSPSTFPMSWEWEGRKTKEVVLKWNYSIPVNTPDWWGEKKERMDVGLVGGCFHSGLHVKGKGWLEIWGQLGHAP